ncbi:MAG: hypothetical protein OXI26_05650, partial [bacterium]|nr:hypothetical protein [bacterium]
FVLSLSARSANTPYVIDPRFPLFQQALPVPKTSHTALAKILGDEDLVRTESPTPVQFDSNRIRRIGEQWVQFNLGYRTEEAARFQKYAERLNEPLSLDNASSPQRILAPYFCVAGREDPWYQKSLELYESTSRAAADSIQVTRVLAAKSVEALSELTEDGHSDDVCIWVSELDEREASAGDLSNYARTIESLGESRRQCFALYGGCFSVILSAIGLGGSSHGIGYGEHRDWRELPRSGPPPARYYLPTIHRYVQQDLAQDLWDHDPALVGESVIEPPVSLGYHDLMLHSVAARSEEIRKFSKLDIGGAIALLEMDHREFSERLGSSLDRLLVRRGSAFGEHLPRWLRALHSLHS